MASVTRIRKWIEPQLAKRDEHTMSTCDLYMCKGGVVYEDEMALDLINFCVEETIERERSTNGVTE